MANSAGQCVKPIGYGIIVICVILCYVLVCYYILYIYSLYSVLLLRGEIVLSTNSAVAGSRSRGKHMLSIRPWAVVEKDAILIVDKLPTCPRVYEY